jgi:hypothetical protein
MVSLCVDFDGFWDTVVMKRIDDALRSCIGNPPDGEEWTVSLTSFSGYCVVFVKTLQQTRRKMFFLRASELVEAIPTWLELYPLR